ncbi:MAG: hypothetical protein ABR552_11035 [Actinomycetota bacterium]
MALAAPVQSRAGLPLAIEETSPPAAEFAQGSGNFTTGYSMPLIVVSQDGAIDYTNLDPLAEHDVLSVARTTNPAVWDARYCNGLKPLGWKTGDPLPPCPLFESWTGSATLTPVAVKAPVLIQTQDGTPKLDITKSDLSNAYPFYCSAHLNMRGLIVVLPPNGSPHP